MTTTLIEGGRLLTPEFAVVEANVLVDDESGTIRDVGADVTGGDERLDASGGLVVPGLVNAHCHVAMTLLRGHADDKPLDAWLREDIWPVEAALEPADVRVGTELGVVEMLKNGVTAFGDMYFELPEIAAGVEAGGIRARLGHAAITIGKEEEAAAADVAESFERAAALDGAADGRISMAVMGHSLTTVSPEAMAELAEGARERGLPLHYHANETVDEVEPIVEREGVRPLAYAAELGALEAGDFLAHCVHVDDREIELLAETGAAAVHCPASNMKLASGIAPVQAMLDAGVTVGIGTDGAASNNDLDVFDELRDAAMVGKLAAEDAAAVDAETALSMATVGGSEVLGFDGGRIEPGANADLAVVDLDAPHLTPAHDLVSNLVYAARGSDVRHTVCDGRVVVEDRELLTLDEAAVRERAAEHAAALVARAE